MKTSTVALLSVFSISVIVWICSVDLTDAAATERISNAASFEEGNRLFHEETFGGNDRVCATCHRSDEEFTLSPETAQRLFARNPDDPLFRPVDSNDGNGHDYTNLLQHALIRVEIPLNENVRRLENPSRRTIRVWRGVPSIANVVLTAPYLQDARGATLQEQAAGAIADHIQPSREPHAKELDSLALYEQQQFYPLRLRALTGTQQPPPREFSIPLSSDAAKRGQTIFQLHCQQCHGGETRHRPLNPHQPQIDTVFVSEANRLDLDIFHLAFRNADGSITEVETPDPGRAAITGRLSDLNKFDTPPLRGLKHTTPYFHDNSATTLEEVIDHYNDFFPFGINDAQKQDLIVYLELL